MHFPRYKLSLIIVLYFVTGANSFAAYQQNGSLADHPRLFFRSDDISQLRQKTQSSHAEIWQPIIDFANWRLRDSAPPADAPDEGQSAYRNYANRLIPFAFCAAITDADSLKNFARNYLLTLAKWQQWGNNGYRDLALAHMLLANSLAYDWLFDDLNERERQTVRQSLADWAEKMYEASAGPRELAWGNWWRKSYVQNHHWINNAALGMAGLALLGEDERAQKWIDQATDQLRRVQHLLNGTRDGSWHEGMHYQSYGLTLALPFLYCMNVMQNTDLIPETYLKEFVDWRLFNFLPGTVQPLFTHGDYDPDWGSAYPPQNILRFVAAKYRTGVAEWLAQKMISTDGRYANQWRAPWYVFEFLYYDPQISAKAPATDNLTHIFPDFSGVIWRTGWHADDLVFGLKSGGYAGNFNRQSFISGNYPWQKPYDTSGCQLNIGHDHDDTNTYYLFSHGSLLAGESAGNGAYSTSRHNTILIDGQGQYRPQENWKDESAFIGSAGNLEQHFSTAHFKYVVSDATARYKNIPGMTAVSREVLFIAPSYFLMFDQLRATSSHDYALVSHFTGDVIREDNWLRGRGDKDQTLAMGIVEPVDFNLETGNDGRPFVRVKPQFATENAYFITVLQPLPDKDWPDRFKISQQEKTQSREYFKLVNKRQPTWVDEIIWGNSPATVEPIAQFQTDARLALIRRNNEGKLFRVLFYGGKYLKDDSRNIELVASDTAGVFIDIDYAMNTVFLDGVINGQVRIRDKAISKVRAGDRPVPFRKSGAFIVINADQLPPATPTGIQIQVQ